MRETAAHIVQCPTCSTPVPWVPEQKWRPFCSERCHLIDLGSWLDESNRIPTEDAAETPED
jgi:endogenous inhibitor of DNA gyrase (YacG/DUF329 family)